MPVKDNTYEVLNVNITNAKTMDAEILPSASLAEQLISRTELLEESGYKSFLAAIKNGEDVDFVATADEHGDMSMFAFIGENTGEIPLMLSERQSIKQSIEQSIGTSIQAAIASEQEKNVADEIIDQSRSAEFKEQQKQELSSWYSQMSAEGKLTPTNTGWKVNSDYYKNLPRNDRHIETFDLDKETMDNVFTALINNNIEFSAVSKNDQISITVAQKDAQALDDIVLQAENHSRSEQAVERSENDVQSQDNQEQQPKKLIINPDFYKNLPKQDRYIIAEAAATANAIINKLEQNNIPFSAVERKGDTMAITVSTDSKEAIETIKNNILQQHEKEVINPEFYKSLSKNERYTQRMPEKQARDVVSKLADKGISHSAVINGDKSGVTIKESDYPQAKKFFMSGSKLKEAAKSAKKLQAQKDNEKTEPQKSVNRKKNNAELS